MAGKSVSAEPYMGNLYQGYAGNSTPKDLTSALQVLYAYSIEPRKDTAFFNKNLRDLRVIIANKYANPMGVFQDSIGIFMANKNPRLMPTTLADIDKANIDESLDIYKKAFANANGMNFVFVGNFKVAEIQPMIEQYIGALPSNTAEMPQYLDRKTTLPLGKHTIEVRKGIEDKSVVVISLHDDYEFNRKNNLILDAIKEGLQNKVMERLREKEGGVYSPNVSISTSLDPKAIYSYSISFSCASENTNKLIKAAMEELDNIRNNGITKADFDKFKSESARSYEVSINNNSYWLSVIESKLKNKQPLAEINTYKADLQKISIDEVKEAAKKYLSTNNVNTYILWPEKTQ